MDWFKKLFYILIVVLFFAVVVTKTRTYITEQKITSIINEHEFHDKTTPFYNDEIIHV